MKNNLTKSTNWSNIKAVVGQIIGSPVEPEPPANDRHCLLLDASPSMKERDYPPNRYQAGFGAVEAYNRTRAQWFPDTLLSLCLFDGRAREVIPNRRAGEEFAKSIQHLRTRRSGNGTNFYAALMRASGVLSGSSKGRRIVLLTDGQHCVGPKESAVVRLSENLRLQGIVIEAVGIGRRKEVNERLLLSIVSIKNGRRLYRWIGDSAEELVQHYQSMALRR